jgi:hypothetical protein
MRATVNLTRVLAGLGDIANGTMLVPRFIDPLIRALGSTTGYALSMQVDETKAIFHMM